MLANVAACVRACVADRTFGFINAPCPHAFRSTAQYVTNGFISEIENVSEHLMLRNDSKIKRWCFKNNTKS